MSDLVVVLVVLMMLACPLVMGGMMLMMWRGMRQGRDRQDGHARVESAPGPKR
jgi:hypothetical protein